MTPTPVTVDEALAAGIDVIVDSPAIVRHVRRYAAGQAEPGQGAWETPPVTTLQTFVQSLWHARRFGSALPAPVRVSPLQAEALWLTLGLDHVDRRVARRIARARAALIGHGGTTADLARHVGNDSDARLLGSLRAYDAALAERDLADDTAALALAPAWIAEADGLPDACLLATTDTPAARAIATALAARGVRLHALAVGRGTPVVEHVLAADADGELRAAARWAMARATGRDACASTGPAVAVAIPDLDREDERVRAVFADELGPEGTSSWALSSGTPPARMRAVGDAFALLRARAPRLELDDARALLRSVHHRACQTERRAWLAFERDLVAAGETSVTRRYLIERLRGAGEHHVLARALERAPAVFDDGPRRRSVGAWMIAIGEWLDGFGWPGPESALTEAGLAAVETFREAVAALGELDAVVPPVGLGEALGWLERAIQRAPTIKREATATPVLVVDVGETALPVFADLWVAGLTERAWPPPAEPDPLLPAGLQRELGLASAAAQAALATSRRTTDSWTSGRGHRVLSSPVFDEDRMERPSPLVPALAAARVLALSPVPAPTTALESLIDESGPPFVPPEGKIDGGARLLELQAGCPFRAFAERRLRAEHIDDPRAGLDARERGNLVHKVLEDVYVHFSTADALKRADESARREVVAAAVAERTDAFERRSGGDPVRHGMLGVERERLVDLIMEWLDVDARREVFTVVSREAPQPAVVAGLKLELRADRVDRLSDGRVAIIDYKTGRVSPSEWQRPRLVSVQLPLYAVASEAPVAGVAFATLRPGECAFKVLGDPEAAIAPGMSGRGDDDIDWQGQLDGWREAIERLGREFTAGFARVAPERPQVCETCGLHPLCRIQSAALADEWGEAPDASAHGGE